MAVLGGLAVSYERGNHVGQRVWGPERWSRTSSRTARPIDHSVGCCSISGDLLYFERPAPGCCSISGDLIYFGRPERGSRTSSRTARPIARSVSATSSCQGCVIGWRVITYRSYRQIISRQVIKPLLMLLLQHSRVSVQCATLQGVGESNERREVGQERREGGRE